MPSRFSPSASSAGHDRRFVLPCAVLFSLLTWGALIFAVVDLV